MPVANLGKVAVISILERGGKVKDGVVIDRKLASMKPVVTSTIAQGSHIMTDGHPNYPFIAKDNAMIHEVIKHIEGYVS